MVLPFDEVVGSFLLLAVPSRGSHFDDENRLVQPRRIITCCLCHVGLLDVVVVEIWASVTTHHLIQNGGLHTFNMV